MTTPIAAGPLDRRVGGLLPCPCCGAPAAVGYSAKAQLGLPGWTADCTVCTDSAQYIRFTRDRAVESWNTYAAQPVTPNGLGNRRAAFGASVLTDGLAGKNVTTE